MSNETFNTQVTTGEVRFSYVHLLKATVGNFGGDPKYSVLLLIPKNDTNTLQKINAAIAAAKERGKSEKWKGIIPQNLALPLHDGDGIMPNKGVPYGPECKGHWVLSASTGIDYPPKVIDKNQNEIIDPTQIYSGMYGRICLNFAPYNQGKNGVSAYINTWVLKTRDGEPLSGSAPDPADAFGLGAPQTAQSAPQAAPQQNYGQQAWAGIPNAGQQAAPQPNYSQPAQQGYAPQQSQRIDPITGQPM